MSRPVLRVAVSAAILAVAAAAGGALELRVRPKVPPAGGLDLSAGVVAVEATGEVLPLSPEGCCRVEGDGSPGPVAAVVYVPGFAPAAVVGRRGDRVEVLLDLQSFDGDPLVLDLGRTAGLYALAGDVVDDAAEEAALAPPTENPNAAPGPSPPMMNPFAIIEAIIGESIPEILGLDD